MRKRPKGFLRHLPTRPRKVFHPVPTNPRMSEHFDVIIIGTGAGGGTLLHRLAPSGQRILVLERGPFLAREKDNWHYHGSVQYYSFEVMYNREGGQIRPRVSYPVGGYTTVDVPA